MLLNDSVNSRRRQSTNAESQDPRKDKAGAGIHDTLKAGLEKAVE